jgi:acetylglutamate kinase
MRLVVKIGGTAIEDESSMARCIKVIADLSSRGHQIALIHGGGKALTRTLDEMGHPSQFIDGLRVTDAKTRDVAVMVLAGAINKKIVAEFSKHYGGIAMGMCGSDGGSFLARKKKPKGIDIGFVGEISSADGRWVEAIWSHGGVPVISSIAIGSDGEYYNINADEMAASCAIACRANTLIFLTDVPGVKGPDGVVMPMVTVNEISILMENGTVNGGMLPKLHACCHALTLGVGRVLILPASEVMALSYLPEMRINLGTKIFKQEQALSFAQY